jgi:hypothetical protein
MAFIFAHKGGYLSDIRNIAKSGFCIVKKDKMNIYFSLFWILSILFYVLFFYQINRFEKRQSLIIKRYSGNKFPKIRELKKIVNSSPDKAIILQVRRALIYLYLSRISFAAPIIIYFLLAIFR